MNRYEAAKIAFADYSYQVPVIETFVGELMQFEYYIMPDDSFIQLHEKDWLKAQRVYCYEIVQRAHIAAVTSLIRANRWLNGVLDGFESQNLFVFAASFRGFLESSADSHYVLAALPRTFSDMAKPFFNCLNEVPREHGYSFQELEDQLIHYSHGRRIQKGENSPTSHKAKSMRHYLDYLQQHGDAGLHDFYSELCEITHPAADSVICMLETTDGSNMTLNKAFDLDMIIDFSGRYSASTDWLFAQCISPALMTLGLINLMNIPELHTSALGHIDLGNVGRWNEFSEKVSRAFAAH